MVVEVAAEAASAAAETLFLTSGMPSVLTSAVLGGVVGYIMPNQKAALVTSLGAGAVAALASGKGTSASNLAISMATSTAVGLIVNSLRHGTHDVQHQHKDDEKAESHVECISKSCGGTLQK